MFEKVEHILSFFLVFFVVSTQMALPIPVQATSLAWLPVNGPLTPGGTVKALAQSQSDPNTLFALVEGLNGSRLYRSTDRSDHWTMVYQFNIDVYLNDLEVDPGNADIVYLGSSTGLLRSMDGGNHWNLFNALGDHFTVPAPNNIDSVGKADQKPSSCSSSEFTFIWTTNGGVTWNTSDLGCFYAIGQVKVLGSQMNIIYMTAMRATGSNPWDVERLLLKSLDGGQTWQSYNMPSEWRCPLCGDLAIDPLNPQHLYASIDALLMFSQDGGQTWDINTNYNLGINCDWGCTLRLAVSGSSLYAIPLSGLSQPIFRSQDGGSSWWQSPGILPAGAFALLADASQSDQLYVGLYGYGVYRTDNAGSSWTKAYQGIQTPARLTALAVAPSDPQVIFAASDYPRRALFSTEDGGQTWSLPLLDNEYDGPFRQPGKQGVRIRKIAVHPKDQTMAWAGGDFFYAYQKSSGWYRLSSSEISDLKVSPSFPDYPFAAAGNGIAYVAQSNIGPPGYLVWHFNYANNLFPTVLSIDPSQPDHILVASNFTTPNMGIAIDIYSSVDNGLTYQRLSEISADNMIENLEITPSDAQLVIATTKDTRDISHWALISHDGGKSWASWSEGLTGGGVDSFLAVDSNSVAYYGGDDGVYFRSQNGSAWLAIGLQGQTIRSMALFQNSPKFLLAATDQGLFRLNLAAYSLWLPFMARH